MRLRFTKMQGAGNDFVVLDATRGPLPLSPEIVRRLGDRRFGVGADQILVIDPSRAAGIDFGYRIFNAGSGEEVEHCGNGARCFVRYVREHGLTDKRSVRVQTLNRVLELAEQADGRVTVDMGAPAFEHAQVPFDAHGLHAHPVGGFELWPLELPRGFAEVAVLSMGNPHAVRRVDDVEQAPVAFEGPLTATHRRFPQGVNAGFMQVLSREHIRLRVWERGVGETLACGTGACAAVAAGVRLGWLDARVEVQAPGGMLTVEWHGATEGPGAPVRMTGPAVTVYEGEIEL